MITWWAFMFFLAAMGLIFWYLSHPTPFEKRWMNEAKDTYLVDRKARFRKYVEGENQLMLDWEEAFDPVGTAFAKDIAVEMRRAKDNAWLFGSPYKPVREYADQAVCFAHARSMMSNKQSSYKDFQLTVRHCERMHA